VFGARARQVFCENFHVAVKFPRKTTDFADFPGLMPPSGHPSRDVARARRAGLSNPKA
jgi:hypothetical protein